jgi:copper homeostasis protein
MRVKVEVCVTSVPEAKAAEACGADGVELCTWLACGGVTPSSGLVDAVRGSVQLPVRVLVRPKPGGFVHEAAELHALLIDAEILGGGAIGLVTGGLLANGNMDVELMRTVKKAAPESEITFHRAIDQARDPLAVLEACASIGAHRILTSGARTLAMDGAAMIGQLVQQAGERVMIAAAGGINPANVVELVERTGVTEVHFAAQLPSANRAVGASMSSTNEGVSIETVPDRAKIEAVLNALVKAGLR